MQTRLTAVEFFSGIGAFACAARQRHISVLSAHDQSQDANAVYKLNFGVSPISRNLDSIGAAEIPAADIWWMSPPCTPYSVRGKQRDADDPRAQSLVNLLDVLAEHRPSLLLVENVVAFRNSRMYERLTEKLASLDYRTHLHHLCPTQSAVPMKRPRLFIAATKNDRAQTVPLPRNSPIAVPNKQPISSFLTEEGDDPRLLLDVKTLDRYGSALNIINPADTDQTAICFTSGYGKSLRASGSLLRTENGGIRRFAPKELLHLFGFPAWFQLPAELPVTTAWRLIGNSVDVRAIDFLLETYLPACTLGGGTSSP